MVLYSAFREEQFRRRVDKALQTVATILETTKTPRLLGDLDHTYDDKYAIANFMTNTAIASFMNVLERMGLSGEALAELCKAVHSNKRSVTLRFAAEDSCEFLYEKDVNVLTHEVEHSLEKTETGGAVLSGSRSTTVQAKSKVSKRIKEFHWDVGVSYKLICFVGNDPDTNPIILQERSTSTEIVTTGTKKSPIPSNTVHPVVDVNLTWLIQQISPQNKECQFDIDRTKDTCRTPRRNEDVNDAFAFFAEFKKWSGKCFAHFRYRIETSILGKHEEEHVKRRVERSILQTKRNDDDSTTPMAPPPSLFSLNAEGIFCPILPLFQEPSDDEETAGKEESKSMVVLTRTDTDESPLLSVGDIDKFLNEQIRQLDEAIASMRKMFPSSDNENKLITSTEASLALLWHHTQFLTITYGTGIDYIEEELRKQLVSAIGKHVGQQEFGDFVKFHSQRLFASTYQPTPFSYAIRRPNHFPDGMLSIEANSFGEAKMDPIETTVNKMENGNSMYMPINAATSVEFTGNRYLHGWIQYKFESSLPGGHVMPISDYTLTARARQFSTFVVITGVISGPNEFTPKDACIVQNKDQVMIPLLLNELPTAKEFKDAISSLSPEQQRFAKAFRGMQLESSVFGVCVVQLKPQLEVLLGLPQYSLVKEIRLTQDLLSLFIDYQIPSDLLSFDGPPDTPVAEKVAAVKQHVKAVLDVIHDAKKKELEEVEKRAEMNVLNQVADAEVCYDVPVHAFGADIQYWDDALTQEIESIQQLLDEMEDYNDEEKLAEISLIEKELRKAQGTKRSLKMETRLVADVGQRRQYENRLARLEEELSNLQADVRAAKDSIQRTSLMGASNASNMEDSMAEFTNTEDAVRAGDDMLNKASHLQDKTQESLDYTKNMVAESKDVGVSTLAELQRQREVIERIGAAFGGPARLMKRATAPMMAMAAPPMGSAVAYSAQPPPPPPRRSVPERHQLQTQSNRPPPEMMEAFLDTRSEDKSASVEESVTSFTPSEKTGAPLPPGTMDYTAIPKQLDAKFEVHDEDSALRATFIKTDKTWNRMRQENLLTKAKKSMLDPDAVKSEKNKAFDLLDALSRSGSLPIECAELHVVVAVTHCFEKSVLNTVIQDNINPIEKVEKTMLLMGSTIHDVPPAALLAEQSLVAVGEIHANLSGTLCSSRQ